MAVIESKGDGYALFNGVKVLASDVPEGAESIPLDGMNVIEWDGNTEGLEEFSLTPGVYKVSDKTDVDINKITHVVVIRDGKVLRVTSGVLEEFAIDGVEYRPEELEFQGDTYPPGIGLKKSSTLLRSLFAYYPIEGEPEEPTEPDTATYRWKVQDNALISVGNNNNPLTVLEGGIVNGLFNNARYQLATPIKLLHDMDWAVEWRMSGDVTNDSALAKIWAVKNDRSSEGIVFRKTTKSVSFAEQKNTHYYYGVKLNEYGIEYTAEHLYRLQNKVNADGTNMVYLYVDGKEIAPMTHTFSNNGDDGNTNWVVGKDFTFGYMGVERYIMTGFIMDDIAVWESGASEVFPEEEPEISRGTLFLLYRIFSPAVFHALTGKWHWLD